MQIRSVTPAARPLPRRPLAASPATPAAAARQPLAPKAKGSDPLPTFDNSESYRNYVINLVAQARVADKDMAQARQDVDQGKGGQREVDAARERLDAIKLQLMVLRDSYPIPSKWTRSKFFGGEGFDKDAFWKAQVEAIPGKPIYVNPETPKPEPVKPQPKPPETSQPAPVTPIPAPVTPQPGAWKSALDMAVAAYRAGNSNSASSAFAKAIDLAPGHAESLEIALTAVRYGYSNSAGAAFKKATAQSTHYPVALDIAVQAYAKGFSNAATDAFARATDQAGNSTESRAVAATAAGTGVAHSSARAAARAPQRAGTPA
ncbi:MAG: tetratricopeptide repeat protein, partial [Candidatus Sericytochromatia bacterium]